MKIQNLFVTFIVIILMYIVLAGAKDEKTGDFDSIRTKKFELVDDKGTVRASILTEESGETVLRLKDSKGEIRVKLGASETGSGLLLLNGKTEPGIHALANERSASVTITNADGKKTEIK
jgi:hypothetical protein